MIIIDTDVLIEIFDKHSTKGNLALEKLNEAGEDIAITALSLHEVLFGIYKYGNKKVKRIEQLETLAFTRDDAAQSARLELNCEKKGKKIARIDAMIAAMAINRNATFFTFNDKHFKNISKIKLL